MKANRIQNKVVYEKVKVISNSLRFHILELTQVRELIITQLAIALRLSYTKTADYVKMLEDADYPASKLEGIIKFFENFY